VYGIADEVWTLTIQIASPGEAYSLNIASGSSVNLKINWGDGNINTYTTTGIKANTYSSAGTYQVKIRGSITNGNIQQDSTSSYANAAKVISTTPIRGITFTSSMQCSYSFAGCTNLTSIPADLFKYVTNCTKFEYTFQSCTSLASIPTDLFKYNTNVSSFGFGATFIGCTSITAIPADLFKYNQMSQLLDSAVLSPAAQT
jgi:hypothetical protein